MPIAGSFRGQSSVLKEQLSDKKRKPKCILLFSGGLDSSLAASILKNLDIEVIGVHFLNNFGSYRKRFLLENCSEDNHIKRLKELASILKIELRIIDISKEFTDILLNPKFGYGANANPCIDCKIFMLKKGKQIMEEADADFVATGEVLGQRPMSQRLDAMNIIERESGLKGRLLRPLCAKILKETDVERLGIVEREKLLNITGRGRKEQISLAKKIGIETLVPPASDCCLLTDPKYSERVMDQIKHSQEKPEAEEFDLLMLGRHFRISEELKLIVGRNLSENNALEKFQKNKFRFETLSAKGPVGIAEGIISNEKELILCASIVFRYSDAKKIGEGEVMITKNGNYRKVVKVRPLKDNEIVRLRI